VTSTHWALPGRFFLKHLEGVHFHGQPRLEKKVIPVGGLQPYMDATYDSEATVLMVTLWLLVSGGLIVEPYEAKLEEFARFIDTTFPPDVAPAPQRTTGN